MGPDSPLNVPKTVNNRLMTKSLTHFLPRQASPN